ncbi:MAG: diguanylate cyclase [Deltaproteobacteria bacterium]|nr:diguanylate cyclase [Deltaproteobacteria bacterium]
MVAQLNTLRPTNAPSFRALVIEDDASLCGVVRDVLNSVGCEEVRFIASGVEALRVAQALGPDLVLLDLGLPDIDGLEVCRQLTKLIPNVPVVIITARSDESVIQVAFEAGAQDYVAKPFRLGELAARARAALKLRSERLLRSSRESELAAQARRLEETTRELERMVSIDALTGIANRGHFDTLLRNEWNRASRPGSPLSLVLVDVDDFHAFNEHYSHLGGDSCLKDVTTAMTNCLRRPSDVLARYGGEEFVALLPDTDAAGACAVAERLRAAVEELGIEHERSRCAKVVTISAGVATMAPSLDRPPTMLVSAADTALFRAKDSGRNRWCSDADVPGQVVVSRRPWPVCPVIRADPYMAHHIPRYLENRRTELLPVREAARVGDLAAVKAFGHKLKGSGGTFGFDDLSVLGDRLEQSAKDVNRTELLRVVDEIAWYLEHVQVVYRRTSQSITAQLVEQT